MPVDRMRVPIGVRDIVSDDNGLIYLANYLSGDIYRIDFPRKRIIDSMHVGRKIKRMIIHHPNNSLYFTSEYGYAQIDLAGWKMPLRNY
jgi:hypothetical protein